MLLINKSLISKNTRALVLDLSSENLEIFQGVVAHSPPSRRCIIKYHQNVATDNTPSTNAFPFLKRVKTNATDDETRQLEKAYITELHNRHAEAGEGGWRTFLIVHDLIL